LPPSDSRTDSVGLTQSVVRRGWASSPSPGQHRYLIAGCCEPYIRRLDTPVAGDRRLGIANRESIQGASHHRMRMESSPSMWIPVSAGRSKSSRGPARCAGWIPAPRLCAIKIRAWCGSCWTARTTCWCIPNPEPTRSPLTSSIRAQRSPSTSNSPDPPSWRDQQQVWARRRSHTPRVNRTQGGPM